MGETPKSTPIDIIRDCADDDPAAEHPIAACIAQRAET
jgi:hypothetical protein